MNTRAFPFLVEEWVKTLESKTICDYRAPVIGNFAELLVRAYGQNRTMTFVGVSCQPWTKVSTIPEVDAIPLIDRTCKKPRRFVAEVASFFRALESFGIGYRFFYSVSDIEVEMHVALENMGLRIENADAICNVRKNQEILIEMLLDAGVNVCGFSETEVLMRELKATSLHELQRKIAGPDPSYAELLNALYEFEFATVLPSLVEDEFVVWLDVQTFAYRHLVEDFEAQARQFAPDVPLVSVIRNCGNWNCGGVAMNAFLTKQELFAQICGFDIRDKRQVPTDQDGWRSKLMHLNSHKLSEVWHAASGEMVVSDSFEVAQALVGQIIEALEL